MSWIVDAGYELELERLKQERPECPYTEDGKHVWNEFSGDNIKKCHECGYKESLVIPY